MKIWVIIGLVILLITSNAYWFMKYGNLVALTHYQSGDLNNSQKTIKRLMQIIPDIASDRSFTDVVAIATKNNSGEPFEKDGCVWMDKFGLYKENERLKTVVPIYNNGESSPCFQLTKNKDIR